MESYKHAYAKETVARWLRAQYDAAARPESYQIYTEYPICVDAKNNVRGQFDIWAEVGEFEPRIPTYQECIDKALLPLVIFDVVVFYKGVICDVYEIVHRNGISTDKARNLVRLRAGEMFDLWEIDAGWVLAQRSPVVLPLADAVAWCANA